jgi:hypothetical protein
MIAQVREAEDGMSKHRAWLLAVALIACSAEPHSSAPLAAWEPVDPAFAGCQHSCGAHADGPQAGVVAQPGATIGQRTFCPVSGAVFRIDASHPHVDVDGAPLYFCCAGCADYFAAHRAEVLRARGIRD